jgi:hypothetical protein
LIVSRRRFVPRTSSDVPSIPFLDAEQAWFWYVRSQQARRLDNEHIKVLASYGAGLSPPDPRLREQERAHRLWDEALDRLTTVLRRKGIVE